MQEQIWHVDETDTSVGPIGREDSRKAGARYRIVRVSVETEAGEIAVQKRLSTKKTYPNCWDTSAGGNVDYSESYEEAAKRGLAEEIGVTGVELEEVAYFYAEAVDPDGNKMNRFTKVYRAAVAADMEFRLQPGEVSEVKWMSRDAVVRLADGDLTTDGLRQTIEQYYKAT